jgi:hypothetical protein
MPRKRILVLANSVKHWPARCVAGRNVAQTAGGLWVPQQGWIRPVSTEGEGELSPLQLRVEGDGVLGVLDLAEVALSAQCDDSAQPENWFIDGNVRWRRLGVLPRTQLGQFAEEPGSLWFQPGVPRADRVSASYIAHNPPLQSLYLVQLPNSELFRNEREKLRLAFRYRGRDYNLSVTDPRGWEMLNQRGANSVLKLDGKYICLSLTPPLNGQHYKVVAAII